MNPQEAAELLGHCALFDNRKPSQGAAIAWAAALHDVPLDTDTKAAVASYYTTTPQDPNARLWILPHHVKTLRAKIRSGRLENFQYEPLPNETPAEFLARYKGQVQAIASGRIPAPSGQPALEGGPSKQFMAELEAHGWEGNRAVEAELLETVKRSGPHGVECPACHAAIGKPCKTPGGSDKHPLGKPRATPHSARRRAAEGRDELPAAERAAQEQRIRDKAARHLAEADDEIPDAEIIEEAS